MIFLSESLKLQFRRQTEEFFSNLLSAQRNASAMLDICKPDSEEYKSTKELVDKITQIMETSEDWDYKFNIVNTNSRWVELTLPAWIEKELCDGIGHDFRIDDGLSIRIIPEKVPEPEIEHKVIDIPLNKTEIMNAEIKEVVVSDSITVKIIPEKIEIKPPEPIIPIPEVKVESVETTGVLIPDVKIENINSSEEKVVESQTPQTQEPIVKKEEVVSTQPILSPPIVVDNIEQKKDEETPKVEEKIVAEKIGYPGLDECLNTNSTNSSDIAEIKIYDKTDKKQENRKKIKTWNGVVIKKNKDEQTDEQKEPWKIKNKNKEKKKWISSKNERKNWITKRRNK